MNRRFAMFALVLLLVGAVGTPMLCAQEHGGDPAAVAESAAQTDGESSALGVLGKSLGAAFAIGIAAAFGALGQGRSISAACEAMGRNPGGAGPIRITMIIGLALIESLVIYALIIAFIIL